MNVCLVPVQTQKVHMEQLGTALHLVGRWSTPLPSRSCTDLCKLLCGRWHLGFGSHEFRHWLVLMMVNAGE